MRILEPTGLESEAKRKEKETGAVGQASNR